MSLTDSNGGMYMPVAPAYGGGMGGFGGGGWGDGIWLILIVLFALGGGMGGFGGFGGGNYDFPWLLNGQNGINANTNAAFQSATLADGITSVRDGISGLSTQLCNGFSGVNATVNSAFANAEVAANARQIADMQTAFAGQTAMSQGFNGLQSQLASCCCENRLQTANLSADLAREACATRTSDTQNTQTLLNAINTGVQSLKDQMCADKIDAKNEKIADLERQLTMANLSASQTAQTSRILADNAAQTVALEQYLNPVPVPAYVVQNPRCGCAYGI